MIRILVCIKQVPVIMESAAGTAGLTLDREKENVANPADCWAFECALRLRERADVHVTVLSMGKPQTAEMLRGLSAMGGDGFYLVTDPLYAGSDTFATATILSRAALLLGGFDLILCGDRTVDGETGQVGAELAAMLDYEFITGTDIPAEGLPAHTVLAVRRNGVLRAPGIAGLRRAKNMPVHILTAKELGKDVISLTRVVRVKQIETKRRHCIMCENDRKTLGRLLKMPESLR